MQSLARSPATNELLAPSAVSFSAHSGGRRRANSGLAFQAGTAEYYRRKKKSWQIAGYNIHSCLFTLPKQNPAANGRRRVSLFIGAG